MKDKKLSATRQAIYDLLHTLTRAGEGAPGPSVGCGGSRHDRSFRVRVVRGRVLALPTVQPCASEPRGAGARAGSS